MSNRSEYDLQNFKKMKEEMQINYEEKVQMLKATYQQCLNDLQNQYKQNQDKLEVMYQNALMKHNEMLAEQNEAFKRVEVENKQAANERQKIQLEQKKLMKLKVSQQEVKETAPTIHTNGEHKIATNYMQQRVTTKSSTSSAYGGQKKKAADFYFQKNKAQESTNKQPPLQKRNSDFMTRDVSPHQKKRSLERKSTLTKSNEANAFTYDRPTQSATNRLIATAGQQYHSAGGEQYSPSNKLSPRKSPLNGARKSKPDPNSWKAGAKRPENGAPSAPHRAYVPPALAKQQPEEAYHAPSPHRPVADSRPDLPQKLVDEFKAQPKNYPGLIPALHDGDNFAKCLEQWDQLGVLYAEDIIRNAPAHCPVDYHLRVSENDTQSAFGQVDKNGRMQGLGRECHDFIYEGQFRDNVYHGWGRYISSEGVYWGLFNMGLRHGQGKWVSANGETREGNWVNGHLK